MSSVLINTCQLNAAPEDAGIKPVRVLSVKAIGKEPVYNMEVETHHNFLVNGGIVSHNCVDSARYLVKTVISPRRLVS